MKKNIIQDERVVLEKRKIQSFGFIIVWCMLLLSVLIQQFVFNAKIMQYIVEMIIFIVMSLYIIIGNLIQGNDLELSINYRTSKLTIISSLVTGITVAIITVLQNNYVSSIQDKMLIGVVTFISCTVFSYIVIRFLIFINNKRQASISKKLDDDE